MSPWRQLHRGLRTLVRRRAVERELDEELQHFLVEAAAAHVARGLSPEQARRAARLDLGGETSVVEQVRGYGWENVVATTLADVRYGARRLRRDPVFTALAAGTLALGIGATTAIFSAVKPILIEPLPYPHAEQVTMLWETAGDARIDGTFALYRAIAERSHSFDSLAVMRTWQPTVTGLGVLNEPERLAGQRVTADFFRVLGVQPAMGRAFTAAEDRPEAPRVVVLSHGLWTRRFAADPRIVGRQVRLDDDSYEVVGVMPRGFENALAPAATVWTPLRYDLSIPQAFGHHLRTVGRLRRGTNVEQATTELAALLPALRRELPDAHVGERLLVSSLQADVTRDVRPALAAVIGAVILLLAIACTNVTNLLLARGARRRGELALRATLGAGRARVVSQLLAESLLLAILGGALGLVVAKLGVRALVAASPANLPRVGSITVDGTVLAFAVVVTTLVGLLFGLVPALRAARADLQPALRQASPRTAAGGQATRARLVVAEVAIAMVLLVGSGLLMRSLQRLFAVPLGFAPARVLTLQVQASGHRFDDDAVTHAFFDAALAAVRRLPGVRNAAWTSQLPLSDDYDTWGVHFEADPPGTAYSSRRYTVTSDYCATLGIALRRGRLLDAHDKAGAPRVAMISETLARRRFAGRDPIGQRLRVGPDDAPWFTVVGVVGDVLQSSLAASPEDAVYTTTGQWWFADPALSLVVRASGDQAASVPTALAPAIRRAIWAVDKDQPIIRVAAMDDLVAASAAQRRFTFVVFAAFALAALLLASTGVYGILAGSVAERRREIGVRCAMGASQSGILAGVVQEGLRLTAVGVGVGLLAALLGSQAIGTMLFGISRLDPVTYLGVIALLVAVSMVASGAPAWRAARVDPATVLREE
jgi:putative ABC transport system permease protein